METSFKYLSKNHWAALVGVTFVTSVAASLLPLQSEPTLEEACSTTCAYKNIIHLKIWVYMYKFIYVLVNRNLLNCKNEP